ncbi:MAG: formylmethanofuran--tetrahydromethanopterin N-formyltransferase, partial [Planctomycetaceae bacterium]
MDGTDTEFATFLHGDVAVADTFAEAFTMVGTRLIVTADTPQWAETAGEQATGFATSVIACSAEAAIERELAPEDTPDGRPGVSLLLFAFSRDALSAAAVDRVGQCILTCPTTACYNGLAIDDPDNRINIGGQLRFFGDGFQGSKKLGDRRLWRVPVMDGEFLCEEYFGTT